MRLPGTLTPGFRGPGNVDLRWLLLAIAFAIWPVRGVFSWSDAFQQRDLIMYFWPKYLWLRRVVWAGQWPWWDPFVAAGQSAAADGLNQVFFLPTIALRLLLPEPLGFNLWVALPFPLAAWGAYLYLRRHGSSGAAALGAVTFTVCGPVVSTGNFTNLSWSVLFIPWLLWAVDRAVERLTARRIACVALGVAGQACAGEPVTMVTTAGLLVAYVVALPHNGRDLRGRLALTGGTLAALALGAAAAAAQLLPLWWATQQSVRVDRAADASFWAIHPLGLLEVVTPTLFGDYFVGFSMNQPWLTALNSGREPFFYSLYVGVAVLLLAAAGSVASTRRHWVRFWLVVGIASTIGALGTHTPIYPVLQQYVPLLSAFRYPAKYLVFACMALAVLIAEGWDAIEHQRNDRAADKEGARRARALVAAVGLPVASTAAAALVVALVWPDFAATAIHRFGQFAGLPDPRWGVAFMLPEVPTHATRLLLLAVIAAGLLWVALSNRPEARRVQWLLYALVLVDLAMTNGGLNRTVSVDLMRQPDWVDVVRQSPHDRFYFGGRLMGLMQRDDVDAPRTLTLPMTSLLENRVVLSARTVFTPSGAGIRELVSFDLTQTWPREYTQMLMRFVDATRDQRFQWLRRGGVRYCLMREPLLKEERVLARVPNFEDSVLFECDPQAARALVVPEARIVPSLDEQGERLFQQEGGPELLMLSSAPPAAAGTPGPPVTPLARFVLDDPTVVELDVGVAADGGFVLLRDSYDPSWQVEVDGRRAELLRANVLFRAVRVSPGRHTVRFTYVPRPLYYGAAVSAVTALGLLVIVCWPPRSQCMPAHVQPATILVPTE
jgi:Bacterial membrane protein YfhO